MLEEVVTAATFIRVTEVWTPGADGRLHLSTGLYGRLGSFAEVSGKESFGPGEGLPGKAWAEGRPVVLKGFRGSYFKRTEAAEAVGLTAGVALPVFAGAELKGVVTFLFGDDASHVGAVEVWEEDAARGTLRLADGYFGAAEHFAWISRHTRFPKGQGLPGLVWAAGGAVLLRDLGASYRFLRSESAADAGMTAGLGLPVPGPDGTFRAVTLLSALGTPIARRFEIWRVTDTGMVLADGNTAAGDAPASVAPMTVNEVARAGVPKAVEWPGGATVAIPIWRQGAVAQVAAWSF